MLTINNITAGYGSHIVLDDLSLSMGQGTVHGLAGANGSGKTTLLNVLYGIVKPESGTILYNDSKLLYTEIGYLETTNFFYKKITGYEYLGLFQTKNRTFDINKWNGLFELPLDDLIEEYSTGMKKKLALMGVLALERDILILDEPFNSLDLETNTLLYSLISLLKDKGKTILLTSHIIETLTSVCDEIHYLKEGKINASFTQDKFDTLGSYLFSDLHKEKESIVKDLLR